MIEWTPLMVEARFVEAAGVLKQMPDVRVQGYFSTWPSVVHEFSDFVGQEAVLRRPSPTPQAIDRMEETLAWARYMEPDHAKIVWLRASGKPWKIVSWKVGVSRQTAHLNWLYGLCVVAWTLNGRQVPTKLSKRYVIDLVQDASRPVDRHLACTG